MRILISGYYGFNNAGDEAILAAILEGLQRRFPDCEPVVLSSDPEGTRRLHGVQAVQRWSLREVWSALGQCDALIQGGGGLIQDTTSLVSPLYYLGILRMARMRRVPAMVFAQGLGPINSGLVRWVTAREFARVSRITVRDEGSADELARMGLGDHRAVLAADPAVLLSPDSEGLQDELKAAGVDTSRPRALLAARKWEGGQQVAEACKALAARLIEQHGHEVLVAAFQEADDAPLADDIASAHPRAHRLRGLEHPRRMVGHIASADLVVSMRLHGLIFAAAHSVPALGISYDPKVDAFAQRAGQPLVTVADITSEGLISATEELVARADEQAGERERLAGELRAAAELSFDELGAMLGLG